jgi:hypothetical protein
MDREINLDSIRALEEQIQEHERTIIQLKRTRNSLLNVSVLLPPEILGKIFGWNVIPDGNFGGLPKASHNFLFVCHHWFQVASGTPGLWGFWGNSIQDWARQHASDRTAPLDLVLDRHASGDLDDSLCNALRDRATRDTIWRVHLNNANAELLTSIISSITTKGEETRSNSVESFMLWNRSTSGGVDVSDFFSRYHFPKLRCLDLSGFFISSWDLMKSRTTSLTSLWLTNCKKSPLPSLSQMLSILSANPNLQSLKLSHSSIPGVHNDRSSSQIQLPHLKTLDLESSLDRVFGLLNRLELPDKMDDLNLTLPDYPPSELSQTVGPYLGDHLRRRSPDRLRLSIALFQNHFWVKVGDACEGHPTWVWFVEMEGHLGHVIMQKEEEAEKSCFDIFAHIPQENILELTAMTLPILRSGELCIQMCNLTYLHLGGVKLPEWFVEPAIPEPYVFKDILPRLRSISILSVDLCGGDWSPLTNFLTRRAAVGSRISSLIFQGHAPMDEGVVESIRRAVDLLERPEDRSDDESDDDY